VTAAAALGTGAAAADQDAAEAALQRLLAASGEDARAARVEVAQALGAMPDVRFRDLLVLLLLDADVEVARAAIASAGRLGLQDTPEGFLFVPPLVSLLGNRQLKEEARTVLAGFGEAAVEPLSYFLTDEDENIWVRRHVPATLARIPVQRSIDALIGALPARDPLLRDNIIGALTVLRREHPELTIAREPIERAVLEENRRFGDALTLHANLVEAGGTYADTLLGRALEDRQARSSDRTFRLLGLIYPYKDINAARFALERGSGRDRASASEYLDNIVTGTVRKHVMLLAEDMPREERVSRARVLYKTRRRDIDDTLAQLIHDDDQVLAAAAVHMAAARGVGALADDIEFVLTHRDVRDWYVFEAASWALAGTRMPAAERRVQWLEPLPAAEAADRLRQIPLFAHVSIGDLFLIAAAGRHMRHEPGVTLSPAGRAPDALHLLIDGEVSIDGAGTVRAPAAIAADELLGGKPVAADIRATDLAITLSLPLEDLLTLLSNNIALAQGLFRMLLDRLGGSGPELRVLHAVVLPEPVRPSESMSPVRRALVLRSSPLFQRAGSDQLLALAGIARPVAMTPGETLPGADTTALYLVIRGSLVVDNEKTGPVTAGPGDTVGAYATLTGAPVPEQLSVGAAGEALRIDRDALFDLLANQVDLLQLILGALPQQPSVTPEAALSALPR
jgi:HEAT repeat protein/CRP-like cAMP-binding protein